MTPKTLLSGLVLAVLLVAPPLAAADLTIVSNVTVGKKSMTSTQYLTEDHIRTSDGRNDTIIEYPSGKMIQIDHKKKRYYETSLEEMRAHFAQIDAMLAGNPLLEKMMGKLGEVRVEETAETREIAGYETRKYILTLGENFVFEIWAAPKLAVPIQYHDAQKMAYATMGPTARYFEKMYDAMKQIEGFPLATTTHVKIVGFNLDSTSEATAVRQGKIDPAAFAPPAGYKKKKSPFEK